MKKPEQKNISRREFCRFLSAGMASSFLSSFSGILTAQTLQKSQIFWIKNIPDQPFYIEHQPNYHVGVDVLLHLMGNHGLKFFRSEQNSALSGPSGLIDPEDIVLIKVNAQWKYRGCTNSDLVRGLIQQILDHPDIFTGEIVIFENGQGRGSLGCDTPYNYTDGTVHANANNKNHSFLYLVDEIFEDPRVSTFLLDPIRDRFIEYDDHENDGYRLFENLSYPCFTTRGGNRVELQKGIWKDGRFQQNLKLINIPVLKHHDTGGSEITAALKHFYGVLSMNDGNRRFRHYAGLGETCGKMVASVCTPVLNIIDAIWVSYSSLTGYPENTTFRANQILASQDPVALDYWAAKHVLYPIDQNLRHHSDFAGIDRWLSDAAHAINSRGGLRDIKKGISIDQATKEEQNMQILKRDSQSIEVKGKVTLGEKTDFLAEGEGLSDVFLKGFPGDPVTDSAGNYSSRVIFGWHGTIIPEKPGFVFEPQQRIYKDITAELLAHQDYIAYPVIFPPIHFKVQKISNRSLFYTETIHILSWESNPKNNNSTIKKYKIYEVKQGALDLIAELDSPSLTWTRRNMNPNGEYIYAISAVNQQGRESQKLYI